MIISKNFINSLLIWSFWISELFAINITDHDNWKLLEHVKCGISSADRIIGGKNATLGMYPWISRVGYTSNTGDLSFRCGGSLINQLYVVTAAHCVTNLPAGYKATHIRLGEHNTETNPDCEDEYCAEPVQDFTIEKTIVHEKYNLPLYKHDIAVIRLDKPAQYNEHVMPICMPHDDLLSKNFVGQQAEVAGWGIYDIVEPKPSKILQTIKLPIVELSGCMKAFRRSARVGDGQMCVGGKIGEDSCGGDSGGPLMKVESLDGPPKYYFIGLVSFGAKACGLNATPAVYTKIADYITWILDNISS